MLLLSLLVVQSALVVNSSPNSSFKSFKNVGFRMCHGKCFERPVCQSMIFDIRNLICILYRSKTEAALMETTREASEDSISIFVRFTTSIICSDCKEDTRCIQGRSRSKELCIPEDVSDEDVEPSRTTRRKPSRTARRKPSRTTRRPRTTRRKSPRTTGSKPSKTTVSKPSRTTRAFIIVLDDSERVPYHKYFLVDPKGYRLRRLKRRIKLCNLWSITSDNGHFYWMCDDGERLGNGTITGNEITLHDYTTLKGGERKQYRHLAVANSLVMVSSDKRKYRIYSFDLVTSRTRSLKKAMTEVPFYYDKINRRIYGMNNRNEPHLFSVDWKGDGYREFKVRGMSLFVEFSGLSGPRVFTCYRKSVRVYRIEGEVAKPEDTTLLSHRCGQFGTVHIGNRIFVRLQNQAGFIVIRPSGAKKTKWKSEFPKKRIVYAAKVEF